MVFEKGDNIIITCKANMEVSQCNFVTPCGGGAYSFKMDESKIKFDDRVESYNAVRTKLF